MSKAANLLLLAFLPLPSLIVAAIGKAAKAAKTAKGASLAMLARWGGASVCSAASAAAREPIHFHRGTRAALDVARSASPQEDTRP